MIKLTKEQTKIIYISLIVLGSLLFFWIFIYGPQGSKLTLLKNELANIENQIVEINKITAGKELAQAVMQLKIKFDTIRSQLPRGEEDIIDYLSDQARKLKIEVKNIMPSNKKSLGNKIAGFTIEELPISMSLVCESKILGTYLDILRNDSPILVRVNNLEISGKGEGRALLDISLKILAYLSR